MTTRRPRSTGSRRLRATGPLSLVAVAVVFGAAALAANLGQRPPTDGAVGRVPTPTTSLGTTAPTTLAPGPTTLPSGLIPASLPPLAAGPVPTNLRPSLAAAKKDDPIIYRDGCHLTRTGSALPNGCFFGDLSASTTVVLFGDSHAASWFPAFDRLAHEHHWRLLPLTKGACSSADLILWSSTLKRVYDECTRWRANAFARIARLPRSVVFVTNDSVGYAPMVDGAIVPAAQFEDVWAAGLAATIRRLRAAGSQVVVIGDTARQGFDAVACLAKHRDDASACATRLDRAVNFPHELSEWEVAMAMGAAFVDPRPLMCPTDPCPSILGRYLIYRDASHITATFARVVAPRLFELLPAIP